MKEYLGEKSKVYQQTRGKRFILIPAIKRRLKNVKSGGKFLDVGCGNGDFYILAAAKKMQYYGLDKSVDMIARAKAEYSKGHYIVSSAINFANHYKEKFDVILLSMILPCVATRREMVKVLVECKKVLKKDGKIIIGEPYPAFDGYMQFGLFGKQGVKTDFKGYFASGTNVSVSHKTVNGDLTFNDRHWTLTDYFKSIQEAGLKLTGLDECPPGHEAEEYPDFYHERSKFPTYIVLICN